MSGILTVCRISLGRQYLFAQNAKGVVIEFQLFDAKIDVISWFNNQRRDVGALVAGHALARSVAALDAFLATRVTAVEEQRKAAIFRRNPFDRRLFELERFVAGAAFHPVMTKLLLLLRIPMMLWRVLLRWLLVWLLL